MRFDAVRLRVFHELFASIAEECGELLRATAPSPNVRERRDYSCALFDAGGELVAQAAHIPVHLGSAALSVAAVRERFPRLATGDAILLNDPYAGGTHLPDLTLVHAVGEAGKAWFVVTRAHHADVGGSEPGSMAPAADLPAEGLRIPPVHDMRGGEVVEEVEAMLLANTRTPRQRRGDLRAQRQAGGLGVARLEALFEKHGRAVVDAAARALRDYASRLFTASIRGLRPGCFHAREELEGDGFQDRDYTLDLVLTRRRDGRMIFEFSGSDDQAFGGVNANPAIVLAAILYSLCCIAAEDIPVNAGIMRGLEVRTRRASILDPVFPAAVAGGNVETSQRLVDLCFAALAQAGADAPAQSQGTMNNLSLGGRSADGESFALYETLGGGAGACAHGAGASAVQTHMTNTRNTPVEDAELAGNFVVERLTIRRGSGGRGRYRGGDGLIKELRALVPMRGALLAERRRIAPRGADGGAAARPGKQSIVDARGRRRTIDAKGSFDLAVNERLTVETPGGGGFGRSGVAGR